MKNFLLGFLIGIGAILPGVSSGVFLVIFGLYEKLIDSILHFFNNIKKNFLFLAPIILGALVSIFIFSHILQFAFNKYFVITSYTFIGLILGGIPLVYKQANCQKITIFHILLLALTLSISLYLIVLEFSSLYSMTQFSFSSSYLILSGILMSAGLVIPGISKSVILMLLNLYPTYLTAIANLNFAILFPIAIGLLIGCLIFLFVLHFLFSFCKSYTYFAIIGFVFGSTFVLFPGIGLSLEYMLGYLFCIFGFLLVNFLRKK